MASPAAPGALSRPTREVLDDLRRAWGDQLRLWAPAGDGWQLLLGHDCGGQPSGIPGVEVPGTDWRLELAGASGETAAAAATFIASTLSRAGKYDEEIRSFSREISERYEEINLLYSISEILGSIISLEQASGVILAEVASILGASRAALWVHDAENGQLTRAAIAGERSDAPREPIAVDDPCSLTAAVFREARPVILAPGEVYTREECTDPMDRPRGAFLSVPVSYTPPEGEARTVGVINLTGRAGGFSAGDLKLLSAIASQIGAAVENSRLIEESLSQERLVREMELAHDLQLKLLPPLEQFAGYAEVAARCVPAESVGGDFYHLFRLPGNRLGVLIGDVSSHGFGAALIMALTMSAVAIHASEGDPPAEVLRRTHLALIDELETTEMYLTLFYGVIDPAEGIISYANAGHSHAWRFPREGEPERLAVTDPPFGIVDRSTYGEATAPWKGGEDLLFLFTDGLSDALGRGEVEGERALLREVERLRGRPADEIVKRIFSRVGGEGEVADDRTAVLVRF